MLFGMTEFDELKQEYESGKLDKIKGDLESFIKQRDLEIKRFSAKLNIPIDVGLRWYVILSKTVNTANENLDQIAEMKKEIWYRREEGAKRPTEEIVKEWIIKHSDGWRSHRTMQVIYVYMQDRERYLSLLK